MPSNRDAMYQGTIAQVPVWEIASSLLQERATGMLALQQGAHRKVLYFQSGQVVFARSNVFDERLGEMLLREGRIGYRELVDAAQRIRPGYRLGKVLVEHRILTPDELVRAVIRQVRHIVYDAFAWRDGEWSFTPTDQIPREVITLNIPMQELMVRAITRIPYWSIVQKGVVHLDAVFQTRPGLEPDDLPFTLEEEERTLLEWMREPRTVEAICEQSSWSDFDTCRWLVAMLAIHAVHRHQPEFVPLQPVAVPPVRRAVPVTSGVFVEEDVPELSFADLADLVDRGGIPEESFRLLPQVQPPDRAVLSFRCRHRYLWYLLTATVGTNRAHRLVERAIEEIRSRHPFIWNDVEFYPDGEIDWEALYRQLRMYGSRYYYESLDAFLQMELQTLQRFLTSEQFAYVQTAVQHIATTIFTEETAHAGSTESV